MQITKKRIRIIIVDDNSSDGTYETVKNFQIDKAYLKLMKNKKFVESINDGIEASKFDNIIWLDADFQHPPKYINDFIEKSKNCKLFHRDFLKKVTDILMILI